MQLTLRELWRKWSPRWGDSAWRQRVARALGNWLLVFIGLGLVQGVTALSLIIVARRVTPIEYGQFAACTGLLSVLIALPNFGLENWLIAQGGANAQRVAQLWRGAMGLRLLWLALWVGVVMGIGLILPADTYPWLMLTLTAVWLALDSLAFPCFSALRLLNQHHAVTLLQAFTALGVLVALLALPPTPSYLLTFIILRAVIELIGTLLVLVFTRAKLPRTAAPAIPWRTIAQAARPFWIGDLAVITYMRSDTAILSLVGGSAIMGFFGPASSLVVMTYIISLALQVLIIPLLSRTYAQGQYQRFQRLGLGQLGLQGLIGLGVTLSIIALAPFIIFQVFGPAYALAIPILQFLSPVIFFKFLNFGLGAWLTSSGQQVWRTKVQLVFAGVNAITTIVGVLTHGLIGALVVDVLTEACLMLGYLWAVWFTWHSPQTRPQPEIPPAPNPAE